METHRAQAGHFIQLYMVHLAFPNTVASLQRRQLKKTHGPACWFDQTHSKGKNATVRQRTLDAVLVNQRAVRQDIRPLESEFLFIKSCRHRRWAHRGRDKEMYCRPAGHRYANGSFHLESGSADGRCVRQIKGLSRHAQAAIRGHAGPVGSLCRSLPACRHFFGRVADHG